MCLTTVPVGHTGEGNGEAEDVVSAGQAARPRSRGDGAADDQRQQRSGRKLFAFLRFPYELPSRCPDCVIGALSSPGRLGAMVTVTLKLGISILNGGNILVQQVRGPSVLRVCRSQLQPVTDCFCFGAENAGLPEGKKRCRIFQKSVWADDVLQVRKRLMLLLLTNSSHTNAYCRRRCRI